MRHSFENINFLKDIDIRVFICYNTVGTNNTDNTDLTKKE